MPRVTRGSRRRKKRKKILARAKGYFQAKSKLYRYAREAVDRSEKFAYIGRRLKKRDFRALWITRIGAATDQHGLSYSRFIHGLKLAGIALNRKMLAEMAVKDADAFAKLVEMAKAALGSPPQPAEAAPGTEAPQAAPEPEEAPGTEAPVKPEAAAPEPAGVEQTAPEAAPGTTPPAEPAAEAAALEAPAVEPEAAQKKRKARKKPAAEATVPETPAEQGEAAPKKPRPRKKPAAKDDSSESEAAAAPAKKRTPAKKAAKKKSATSGDDSADT